MAIGTRSSARKIGSEAKLSPSASDDITPPPPRRTPATVKTRLPSIREAKSRGGTEDVGAFPKNADTISAENRKRRFVDSEGSEEDDGTHPTNTTPSRAQRTNPVASPISRNSNKIAIGVIPSIDVKKMEFPALKEMASKAFIKVLAKKNIVARETKTQGFSELKVNESKHQTEVCWNSIPGSKSSSVKLPNTAKFGECSVFAVEADTKESFKDKAEKFLSKNMGSKELRRSMALVLHYDSDGKPQSAIVGYLMAGSLHYCDSLEAETANKIAMELNRGGDPTRWHLEVSREASSNKRMLLSKGRRDPAQSGSDTSSD
jgi:hypothetical protein